MLIRLSCIVTLVRIRSKVRSSRPWLKLERSVKTTRTIIKRSASFLTLDSSDCTHDICTLLGFARSCCSYRCRRACSSQRPLPQTHSYSSRHALRFDFRRLHQHFPPSRHPTVGDYPSSRCFRPPQALRSTTVRIHSTDPRLPRTKTFLRDGQDARENKNGISSCRRF